MRSLASLEMCAQSLSGNSYLPSWMLSNSLFWEKRVPPEATLAKRQARCATPAPSGVSYSSGLIPDFLLSPVIRVPGWLRCLAGRLGEVWGGPLQTRAQSPDLV